MRHNDKIFTEIQNILKERRIRTSWNRCKQYNKDMDRFAAMAFVQTPPVFFISRYDSSGISMAFQEDGIINILYGYDPEDVPQGSGLNRYPMGVTCTVLLLLAFLIVLYIVFSAYRAFGLSSRLKGGKVRLLPVLLVTVLVHIALPACVLLAGRHRLQLEKTGQNIGDSKK